MARLGQREFERGEMRANGDSLASMEPQKQLACSKMKAARLNELLHKREKDYLLEYRNAWNTGKKNKQPQRATHTAIDEKNGIIGIGIGIVTGDNKGQVAVAAGAAISFRRSWPAEWIEALAEQEAVKLTIQNDFNTIQIEGDAQLIIRSPQGDIQRHGSVQTLIDDSSFNWVSFHFCSRESNQVPHRLAR